MPEARKRGHLGTGPFQNELKNQHKKYDLYVESGFREVTKSKPKYDSAGYHEANEICSKQGYVHADCVHHVGDAMQTKSVRTQSTEHSN